MENRKPVKLVLMGDFHVDYDYMEGMASECGRIVVFFLSFRFIINYCQEVYIKILNP